MAPPVWVSRKGSFYQPLFLIRIQFPVLDHDIRKLPAPMKPRDRRCPNHSNTQTTSTGQTSLSPPSTADGPTGSSLSSPLIKSSATSASEGVGDLRENGSKKKPKSSIRDEHPLRVQTHFDSPPPQPRYWNEFDDGDEASSDEVYTLFVDPYSNSRHIGAKMMAKTRAWGNKATSWLKSTPQPTITPDRQPLIGNDFSSTQSSPGGDETDLENRFTASRHAHSSQAQRHYSAIQAPSILATRGPRHDRQHFLRTLVAFFTASGIFLFVAALLVAIGFQNYVGTTLAFTTGVVISVVGSLFFGLLGFGTLLTANHEQRSEIPTVMVGLWFVLECLCSSVLLVIMLSGD